MRSRRASDGTNGLGSPPGVLRLEQPSGRINDPGEVIVGIETDRGLWVTAWVAAGYQVYAINPLGASRYRDRHNVGGAKSGPGDAKMLADLVPTDRHNHRQIAGDTPEAEAIRIVARGHQNLIWSRNRKTNALRDALREYYSAALETFAELADSGAPGVLACWRKRRIGRPTRTVPAAPLARSIARFGERVQGHYTTMNEPEANKLTWAEREAQREKQAQDLDDADVGEEDPEIIDPADRWEDDQMPTNG